MLKLIKYFEVNKTFLKFEILKILIYLNSGFVEITILRADAGTQITHKYKTE